MSRFRQITLLKVLAAVAWADGEVTNSELNVLKNLYLHFGLDKRDIDEVQPYIRAPLPPKEQAALFRQLADELSTEESRKEATQALQEMAQADNDLKDEERTLIEEFSRLVEASSITKRSLGKIRNLFKRTLVKPPRETSPEMISYFQQVLAKQFEVKSKGKSKIDVADPKVYLMCLMGTLLSSVAHVDNQLEDSEKKALRALLKEHYSLEKKELDMVFEVIVEQARRGYDFSEVTKEFNRIATYNDRLHCVDAFFAVSAADGDMSHEEVEEIRRITKALRVPHKVFIDRKMEALNKLRGK